MEIHLHALVCLPGMYKNMWSCVYHSGFASEETAQVSVG
jgi:hypothetical protein